MNVIKGNKLEFMKDDNQFNFKINGKEIKQINDFELIIKPNEITLSLSIDITELETNIS